MKKTKKKSIILNDWCAANFWSDIIFYSQAHSLSSALVLESCIVSSNESGYLKSGNSNIDPKPASDTKTKKDDFVYFERLAMHERFY